MKTRMGARAVAAALAAACVVPACIADAAPAPASAANAAAADPASPPAPASTPPMGWNPYNVFSLDYGEAQVMAQAQALVRLGLADRGYRYVNVDDGWWLRRGGGTIAVRTGIYPSAQRADGTTSLRPFVDRLHAMGLKAGIYTDIGRNACSQRWRLDTPNLPVGTIAQREIGTYGHHAEDAALLFAAWDFDFIKIDACGVADYAADAPVVRDGLYHSFPPLIARERPAQSDAAELARQYAGFAEAARRARPGRPPLVSLCAWGQADVNDWGAHHGQMWRTSGDIDARWSTMLTNFDSAASRALFAGPGRWNDPDMLEVGNGEFDGGHLIAARAHMSLWAVLAAPLILGNDLTRMTPEILAIVANPRVIAVNQDRAGNQGVVVMRAGDGEIVAKALAAPGRQAVALINRGRAPLALAADLADLGLSPRGAHAQDLWTGRAVRIDAGRIAVTLAPQETALLLVRGEPAERNVVLPAAMPARFDVLDQGYKAPDRTPQRQWVLAQIGFLPYGEPLMLGDRQDHAGLGVAAGSRVRVRLDGRFRRVTLQPRAVGGMGGTYIVSGDGRVIARGAAATTPTPVSLDVRGVRTLELAAPAAAPGVTAFAWHRLRFIR